MRRRSPVRQLGLERLDGLALRQFLAIEDGLDGWEELLHIPLHSLPLFHRELQLAPELGTNLCFLGADGSSPITVEDHLSSCRCDRGLFAEGEYVLLAHVESSTLSRIVLLVRLGEHGVRRTQISVAFGRVIHAREHRNPLACISPGSGYQVVCQGRGCKSGLDNSSPC